MVGVRSADVAAVNEPRAVGVHLGHEAIVRSVVCQIGSGLYREALDGRGRVAGHVGAAGAIHGDAEPRIDHASADVAAVDESRAIGVHLGHEGVLPAVVGEVGADLDREAHLLVGVGDSGHVRTSCGIHCDAVSHLGPPTADVPAVDERLSLRVDLGHEGVPAAPRQAGPDPHGKRLFVAHSLAHHVGIAGGVQGDVVSLVVVHPADVSAVDERGACGIHLGHEGVRGIRHPVEGQIGTHLGR